MVDISKIDMNRIEGLLDKLDSMKYVVESWCEGSSWYRVWSDGWIEQGGYYNDATTSDWAEIQLYKPYKDTNYLALCSNSGSSAESVPVKIGSPSKNTKNSIFLSVQKNYAVRWYTCGY